MSPKSAVVARWRRPPVQDDEVRRLATRYGAPIERNFALRADDYVRAYRFNGRADRRAEVVFAIQDPGGGFWVHAKRNYPSQLFRLPSGGIGWREGVEHALVREIAEETALSVHVERFLGLLRYEFTDVDQAAQFASYVFLVRSAGGEPAPHASEAITEFRQAPLGEIPAIAASLRSLVGNRQGWGQWRALAHDLLYEAMASGQ